MLVPQEIAVLYMAAKVTSSAPVYALLALEVAPFHEVNNVNNDGVIKINRYYFYLGHYAYSKQDYHPWMEGGVVLTFLQKESIWSVYCFLNDADIGYLTISTGIGATCFLEIDELV